MKKYISIILSLTLILCLVSCDLSGILGAFGSTADTSISTTTTATTVPKDPDKIETLEELIFQIDYDFILYRFYTANRSFSSKSIRIDDFEDFFEILTKNTNQPITNNEDLVRELHSQTHYRALMSDDFEEQLVLSMGFCQIIDTIVMEQVTIHIYADGRVYIIGVLGDYITINSGIVDWELILSEYFYKIGE